MIVDVVEGELPNAPSYVRPMIVGTAACAQYVSSAAVGRGTGITPPTGH